MELSAITPIQTPEQAANAKDKTKLKEACDQVEGMFLKILLKESMQSMMDSAEGHSSSVLGYAVEQTGEEIAREGSLGIAESVYQQLSANL